jgi:chemotaxis protein histidine kinase CheA
MTNIYEEKVAAARQRMAALGEKFLERTRGEIEIMRANLVRVSSGEVSALAEVRNIAHRACGTGATLGFESLSECAYRIEQITANQATGTVPDETSLAALSRAIEDMAIELDRQRPS